LNSILESWRYDGWKTQKNMKTYKDYVEKEGAGQAQQCESNYTSSTWFVEEGGGLEDVDERDFNRTLQEEKANQFFRFSQESLHKHFGRYGSDLVVYALFGERQTAKILVARHLNRVLPLLEETDNLIFMSTAQSHKKGSQVKIDLRSFAEFVTKRVDNDDDIFEKNAHLKRLRDDHDAITKIANGLDIWNKELTNRVAEDLREFYKMNYAALATTTHFVEAGVKAAKDADNKSRTETRMSHYGIACNAKLEINENTKASMIKAKSEKEEGKKQRYEDEDHLQARGKAKTVEAIKYAKKLHYMIKEKTKVPRYQAIYEEIKKKIVSNDSGFDQKRAEENYDKFIETANLRMEKGMKLTKAQRRAGYDVTPLLQGAVGFNELRTIHLSLVKDELVARNIDPPLGKNKGIKAFRDALKNHMITVGGNKSITHFKPIAAGYYEYFPDDAETGDAYQVARNNEICAADAPRLPQNESNSIEFTKLRKAPHLKLLLSELMGRGVTIPQGEAHLVTSLKNLLKNHEQTRLRGDSRAARLRRRS
jgi:hypothetical protein